MARELTTTEIEKLASGKNVRRIAVENFLSSMDVSEVSYGNIANCQQDALSYKWNRETVAAIREGIRLAYQG